MIRKFVYKKIDVLNSQNQSIYWIFSNKKKKQLGIQLV